MVLTRLLLPILTATVLLFETGYPHTGIVNTGIVAPNTPTTQVTVVRQTATPTPAPSVQPSAIPTPDGELLYAAGKATYLKQYCGICHALAAASTTGVFGPSHDRMGMVAAQRIEEAGYDGEAQDAAAYIRESIVSPEVYAAPGTANVRHRMPSYAHLAEAELDALVYFLLEQK
ncbi:MAG: hypothetical protein H3C34_03165 [Caldilineaceae bacterium]|nr:hypothetical protein [Caldilineaceae bacterium]